ncbi:hypothetical protein TWF281_006035 [Arthrobotrys megalospora]
MGWFDSLVNGVGDAVRFIERNSGTIGKAVEVIGEVSRLSGLEFPELLEHPKNEFQALLTTEDPDLNELYQAADRYLNAKAEKQRPVIPAAMTLLHDAGDGVTKKTRSISGVWKMPESLEKSGNPLIPLYHDLARFLGQSCFPLTLQTKNGIEDVAHLIAQAIFVNNGDDHPEGPQTATFEIASPDGTIYLSGCRAYYEIPMGEVAKSSSWHSAINMCLITNEQGRLQIAADRQRYEVCEVTAPLPTSTPVWIVTLDIDWNSIQNAYKYSIPFTKLFQTNHPDYHIIYNKLTGLAQILKVQAPEGVAPDGVRDVVIATLKQVMQTPTSQIAVEFAGGPIDTVIPEVYVTNSYISWIKTTDDRRD